MSGRESVGDQTKVCCKRHTGVLQEHFVQGRMV